MNKKNLFMFFCATQALLFNACDSNSSNPTKIEIDDWELSNVINLTEIPKTCTSLLDGDSVFTEITFQNWSWIEQDIFDGNKLYTIETFTGLEDSDLKNICNDSKNDMNFPDDENIKITRVNCNGNIITLESILSDSVVTKISPAVFASTISSICKKLLEGEYTIKDIFFVD